MCCRRGGTGEGAVTRSSHNNDPSEFVLYIGSDNATHEISEECLSRILHAVELELSIRHYSLKRGSFRGVGEDCIEITCVSSIDLGAHLPSLQKLRESFTQEGIGLGVNGYYLRITQETSLLNLPVLPSDRLMSYNPLSVRTSHDLCHLLVASSPESHEIQAMCAALSRELATAFVFNHGCLWCWSRADLVEQEAGSFIQTAK
jgi:hypothetical protein